MNDTADAMKGRFTARERPMTDRLAKLVALRKAVEAGDWSFNLSCAVFPPEHAYAKCTFMFADDAFNGSLDDALALLEAVLPGVQWAIYSRPPGVVASIIAGDPSGDLTEFNKFAATPARALLLVILSALIERERTG